MSAVEIILSVLYVLYIGAYLITFQIQKNRIKELEKAVKVNSGLVKDLEVFKNILNVDDFRKHVELKVENISLEKEKEKKKEILILQEMLQKKMQSILRKTASVEKALKIITDLSGYLSRLSVINRPALIEANKDTKPGGGKDIIDTIIKVTEPKYLADMLVSSSNRLEGLFSKKPKE